MASGTIKRRSMSRAWTAAAALLLLCLYTGGWPPAADASTASTSLQHIDYIGGGESLKQKTENSSSTTTIRAGGDSRQKPVLSGWDAAAAEPGAPEWRQQPGKSGSSTFGEAEEEGERSIVGSPAWGRTASALTWPTWSADVGAELPAKTAVRTHTKEEEENAPTTHANSRRSTDAKNTYSVPPTSIVGQHHDMQQAALERLQKNSVGTLVQRGQGRNGTRRPGLHHRLRERWLPRPATRIRRDGPDDLATSTVVGKTDWEGLDFAGEVFGNQQQQQQQREVAEPQTPFLVSRVSRSSDPVQQSRVSVHKQTMEERLQQQLDFHRTAAEEAPLSRQVQRVAGIPTATLDVAASAEEDEQEGQLLQDPRAHMKKDVLFHSTNVLAVRRTVTGELVCVDGGVYGFATAEALVGRNAGEGNSSLRVQVRRNPANGFVLLGDTAIALAATEDTTVPFASSVSDSAAAAAAQSGSSIVLLCTAPGQPLVAMPATDVQVLHKKTVEQKRKDLEVRAQYLRDAAAWRWAVRQVGWLHRLMRVLVMATLATFVISFLGAVGDRKAYDSKRQQLLVQVLFHNPSALMRHVGQEAALQKIVLDMSMPQSVVDSLPERSDSALKEMRSLRRGVKTASRAFTVLVNTGLTYLAVHICSVIFKRSATKMNRKRRLVLQGVPLHQIDAIAAREEQEEQSSTGQHAAHDRTAAGAAPYGGRTPGQQGAAGENLSSADAQDRHQELMQEHWLNEQQQRLQQLETPGTTTDRRVWQAEVAAGPVDEEEAESLEMPGMVSLDPMKDRDELFFAAVRDTEYHWNAAALLTPDRLKDYNVILVLPDAHGEESIKHPEDTRLLTVYDAERPQQDHTAHEQHYAERWQ